MSEYINFELLAWVCGSIVITYIVAYLVSVEQIKKAFDAGCDWGKFDMDRQVLRAENKAFVNGYEKAKSVFMAIAKDKEQKVDGAQKSKQAVQKSTKKATKNQTNPVNTRRAESVQKTAKKAVKGK